MLGKDHPVSGDPLGDMSREPSAWAQALAESFAQTAAVDVGDLCERLGAAEHRADPGLVARLLGGRVSRRRTGRRRDRAHERAKHRVAA